MNNIINKSISNEDRPDLFSAVWLTLLDYVRRLVRFFTLTEEERFKAGIYTGGEGRER